MISKSMLKTAAVAIAVLAVINNVSALAPVKELVSGDKGWF